MGLFRKGWGMAVGYNRGPGHAFGDLLFGLWGGGGFLKGPRAASRFGVRSPEHLRILFHLQRAVLDRCRWGTSRSGPSSRFPSPPTPPQPLLHTGSQGPPPPGVAVPLTDENTGGGTGTVAWQKPGHCANELAGDQWPDVSTAGRSGSASRPFDAPSCIGPRAERIPGDRYRV